MKLDQLPLTEIRVLDTAPKGFQEFLAKYRKLVRDKSIEQYSLYVHFSNFRDSPMDKNSVGSPDHSDPIGLYTYPIEYVLKNPADLWYGHNARYLHVVRSNAKNPLYMKDIENDNNVSRILYRMDIHMDDRTLSKIRREHRWTGKWRFAKTFMSAFQLDYSKPDPERKKEWTTRSGEEQTALLRKAGYDSIQDTGTGAVNDREPEQMVFLSRGAFKIIEMFTLREPRGIKQGDTKNPDRVHQAMRPFGPMTTAKHDSNEPLMRKISAHIAQAIQDTLVGKPEPTGFGGKMFWTKQGKSIQLELEDSTIRRRMDTLKIGQKPHKWFKGADGYVAKFEIRTPQGKITNRIGRDEKFKDVFAQVTSSWHEIKDNPPTQPRQTRESHLAAMKAQKDLQNWNHWRKEQRLPAVTAEEMIQMKRDGLTHRGDYTLDRVDALRAERGLPPLRVEQYQAYVKSRGKIDPRSGGPIGPSEHSMGRLDRALAKRTKRGKNDDDNNDPVFRREIHQIAPHAYGPRSMAFLNGYRLKHNLSPISKETYAKYLRHPDGQWDWKAYFPDMHVKESLLVKKFSSALPEDWTDGMWVNPLSDRYTLTAGMSHVTMVATNPTKFDLPPDGHGTPFSKYCTRIAHAIRHSPSEYRAIKDEMNEDDELRKFMTKKGWTRVWGDEGSLELEAYSLKQAQATLLWLSTHGVEVWGIAGLDTWGDDKHLKDLDGGQVEALMRRGRLGTRLGESFENVRVARSADQRVPLPFDTLLGKAFRIVAPEGNTGFSIITPFNRREWATSEDRSQFNAIVKQKFNEPGFLADHKWNQIYDAALRLGLIDQHGQAVMENEHQEALEKTGFYGKQGSGALIFSKSTGRFLVAHRSSEVEQPGTWGIWGGAIDEGEDPMESAKREIMEECGCTNVSKMIPAFVFNDARSGFRYSNFIAIVPHEFTPRLNWESTGARWVEYGDWPQPLHFGLAALLKDPATDKLIRGLVDAST